MTRSTKRIYFDMDEETYMKFKSMISKSYITPRDYQIVIQALIDKAYDKSNAKTN